MELPSQKYVSQKINDGCKDRQPNCHFFFISHQIFRGYSKCTFVHVDVNVLHNVYHVLQKFESLCRIYAGVLVLISLSVATHSVPNFSQRRQSLINMLLARLQNHNTLDKSHLALYANGHPMYKVSSVHNNHNKDRSWNWECRPLLESRYTKCHKIGYMCTSTILINL